VTLNARAFIGRGKGGSSTLWSDATSPLPSSQQNQRLSIVRTPRGAEDPDLEMVVFAVRIFHPLLLGQGLKMDNRTLVNYQRRQPKTLCQILSRISHFTVQCGRRLSSQSNDLCALPNIHEKTRRPRGYNMKDQAHPLQGVLCHTRLPTRMCLQSKKTWSISLQI
jgi:hypothetical protein